MIVRLAEGTIKTLYGAYHEYLYYDGQKESIALVMGDVRGENILCRVHSSCLYGHAFNSMECDCREQMQISQKLIEKAGKGLVIWLEQEGKGNGHYALMQSKKYKQQGMPQGEAYEAAGFNRDARDFRSAAEIIRDLGVSSICLITDNADKVQTLTQHGIIVSSSHPVVF
ncbi:GTP cyclohydrolase [bacterium]|nr:GTP cyclohydrolase [bacterium]NUN44859.1 GTP cyclohydrolase [bacterium]